MEATTPGMQEHQAQTSSRSFSRSLPVPLSPPLSQIPAAPSRPSASRPLMQIVHDPAYDEFCPRQELPVLHEKPTINSFTNRDGSSVSSKSRGGRSLLEKGSQAGDSAGERFEVGIVQAAAQHAFEMRRLILKLEAEIERLNGHALPGNLDLARAPLLGSYGNEHGGGALYRDEMRAGMEGLHDLQKKVEQVEESTSEQSAVPQPEIDAAEKTAGKRATLLGATEDENKIAMGTCKSRFTLVHDAKKGRRIVTQRKAMEAARRKKAFAESVFGADLSAVNLFNEPKSLRCLVGHPYFDAICAVMILTNAATIGYETQTAALKEETPSTVEGLGIFLTVFFFLELVLRVAVHQKQWFTNPDMRLWNYFDALLVGMSLADLIAVYGFTDGGSSALDEVKMLKTLRIVRVFRVFRFFRQLTQLALMIGDSVRSLVWAMVLLGVIIYVFAIVITAQSTSYIHSRLDTSNPEWFDVADSSKDLTVAKLNLAFGDLSRTVYTLFQTVLGGVSWAEVTTPLLEVGVMPFMLLLGYISFVVLAVLNVVTGVFVDNAFRSAEKQRNLAIQKEMERKEQYIDQIKEFFQALDQDGSGDVTTSELAEMLADPTLSAYFRVLGFEIDDATRFVDLLDADESGSLGVDEFLEGCLRLRGRAQAVDVHQIIRMVKTLHRSFLELRSDLGLCDSRCAMNRNLCL